MGRDVLDAFAVDPDLTAVAEALQILGAGVRARPMPRGAAMVTPPTLVAFAPIPP